MNQIYREQDFEAANRTLETIALRAKFYEQDYFTATIKTLYKEIPAQEIIATITRKTFTLLEEIGEKEYADWSCERVIKSSKTHFMDTYIPDYILDETKVVVYDLLCEKNRIAKIGGGKNGRATCVVSYKPLLFLPEDKKASEELADLADLVLKTKDIIQEIEIKEKQNKVAPTLTDYNTWR